MKRRRGIPSEELGFDGETSRVYANDHLTLQNKILHKKAREFCSYNNFKYVWVRDSKIFIKKTDTSKAILIRNESIFSRLAHRGGSDVSRVGEGASSA